MSSQENEDESWSCWLRTTIAGSGAMFLLMFVGMNEAQTSVMLPQLKNNESKVRITLEEEAWIASVGFVMTPVSALIFGPFLDVFGRKAGLQMYYIYTCLGYAVMSYAHEVYQIYICRIICGIGSGLFASAVAYMVEICTPRQREYFFALTSALFACGVTVMCIVGGYLPWRIASFIFSITAFILFIFVCFIPETPPWLFKMGREDAAINSLLTLGRSESAIRQELSTLRLQCKEDSELPNWRMFLEPTVWKPFVIMIALFFLQCASGLVPLLFYTVDFVGKIGTTYNPLHVAVFLAVTRLLACSTVVIFFRSRVDRKFAIGFSALWMAIAFVGLGAYEYMFRDVKVSERPFQWLPVAFLLVYIVASVLGMLGIPWVMSGEVYPLRVRGTMMDVTYVIANGITFVFVKNYHNCINLFRIYGILFISTGFCCLAIIFAVFVLPETRNKSLFEIEQSFLPKSKRQLEAGLAQITRL